MANLDFSVLTKICLWAFLFITIGVSKLASQDKVIRTSGEIVNCKVIDEDSTQVFIRINRGNQFIQTSIKKSDIREILYPKSDKEKRNLLVVGFLQGGGSLVGVDFETMVSGKSSLQIGAGFKGFGFGYNVHFSDGVNSPYLGLNYWHQGIGNTFVHSLVGPTIGIRFKSLLSMGIGAGVILKNGPNAIVDVNSVILTYSIGLFTTF